MHTVLSGRWELREALGQGASATVFRGRDLEQPREVAVKLLHQFQSTAQARFAREAETLARLRHPALVEILASGVTEDGRPFIVQELVRGEPLLAACRPGRLRAPRDVARLLRDVALGLHHAHEHGVVHRDLKPSNILVDLAGRARVVDFGIAHVLEGSGPALTRDGTMLGSPGYMAPEQVRGDKPGPACDVYGLGATLYHALCGEPPFHEHPNALRATLEEVPSPPGRWQPGVPPALEALALRCLAKRPEERPPGALAVVEALDAWLREVPGGSARAVRAPLVAAAVVLFGAALALVLALRGRGSPPWPSPPAATTPAPPAAATTPARPPLERLQELARREPPPRPEQLEALLRELESASPELERARVEEAAALRARAEGLAREGGPWRPDVAARLRLAVLLAAGDATACGQAELAEVDYAVRRAHFDDVEPLVRFARASGRAALELRLQLAGAHLANDRRGEGRALLQELARADPDGVVGQTAVARLLAIDWRYEESNALAERVLAREPDFRPALRVLAVGLAFRGQCPRALELLARARAQAPDDAQVHVTAAYALNNLGRTEEGARAATVAIELAAPTPYVGAIKARGIAHLRGGRAGEAVRDFSAALELRQGDADLLIYRGAAWVAAGDRRRAGADWGQAWERDATLVRRRVGDLPRELGGELAGFIRVAEQRGR